MTGRRRVHAVRGPAFRPGRRGELGEHAVGSEQMRAVLAGELAYDLDLRVQIGAPFLSLFLSYERGTGLDDAVNRQEERLDENQLERCQTSPTSDRQPPDTPPTPWLRRPRQLTAVQGSRDLLNRRLVRQHDIGKALEEHSRGYPEQHRGRPKRSEGSGNLPDPSPVSSGDRI